MKRIRVVTSILRNSGKLLILKRSQKVGSFQGYWHGVSGYLEKGDTSTLKRAYAEVREETGIPKKSLTLVSEGKPVSIKKKGINTEFLIHPFLFESKRKSVKINWESDEYKWVYMGNLKRYKTVPGLPRVLKSVLR